MLDSRSKKLVSLLFAVIILLSCVVVYQFVEPQEVKGEEHQTLGLSVSPFGSTFKLGVNQSKTFTAQALNGSAPFCFSWKIVPSAPLTLQVNGETLQLTEKIVVDDGSLTVCFPEASEDFVTVTLSGIDVNGLVGEADAFIVADPYTSSGYYFDGSQAVYSYKVSSDGLGWYRVYGSNGAALTAYDGTNSTLVTDALLGDMTSGALFLDGVAFDLDLLSSIPEDVRVICLYEDEYWEYINNADSSGSPYTVSVGSGVNNGYYLAQDGEGRICYSSTDGSTVIQAAHDALGDSGRLFLKGTFTDLDTITLSKDVVFEMDASGTWGNPNLVFDTAGNGITVTDNAHVVLKNLYIDMNNTGGHAIDLTGSYFSSIEDLFIMRAGRRGINIEPVTTAPYLVANKIVITACNEEGFYCAGSRNSFNIDILYCVGNGNGVTPKVANVDLSSVFYSNIGSLVASGGSPPYGGESDYGVILRTGILALSVGNVHLETLASTGLRMGTSVGKATQVYGVSIGTVYAYNVATVSGAPVYISSATSGTINNLYISSTVAPPYTYSVEVYNVTQFNILSAGAIDKPILDYYGNKLSLGGRDYFNGGTATIASGTNTVSVAHNMAVTPSKVTLGATHVEVSGAWWSANSTHITITVTDNTTADRQITWIAMK